ncbi:MAG: hypothetical protein CM15mP120_09910 [Pseudomonadota bacterium]|nr:MAG: hypothetical protein CM15mP120_09910 [Pseudomonadota bacterium]
MHRLDRDGFELGDSDAHFETLPRNARDLAIGHHSVNFDRGGFAADINVVSPNDRLEEMCEPKNLSATFPTTITLLRVTSQTPYRKWFGILDRCAPRPMLDEGVDVVLLTGT